MNEAVHQAARGAAIRTSWSTTPGWEPRAADTCIAAISPRAYVPRWSTPAWGNLQRDQGGRLPGSTVVLARRRRGGSVHHVEASVERRAPCGGPPSIRRHSRRPRLGGGHAARTMPPITTRVRRNGPNSESPRSIMTAGQHYRARERPRAETPRPVGPAEDGWRPSRSSLPRHRQECQDNLRPGREAGSQPGAQSRRGTATARTSSQVGPSYRDRQPVRTKATQWTALRATMVRR